MGRFLLIGLDGAEPSLVEPWMDEGRLPNLAALRARGAYLPCASTIPPSTFPAWTTCATGVNPGKHGVFDFTQLAEGKYAIQFTNATFRAAPAIWKVLSDAGKRVCVLGVPATYPPESVNGIMVSGFDSPVCTAVDASFVHPAEIYPEVREWRFADFQETEIGPGWHDTALPKLLYGISTKERIARNLLAREPWDFFMMVFGESDTVAHHFWLHHDPKSPRHRAGYEHAIRQVYERLDAAVGEMICAAGDNVTIGVVSDHGFGGAGTGVVHLNNWLAENEYLTIATEGESLLKKLALAVVPERWRGAAFRRFQGLASRAESRSRFAGIKWSDTTAWSEELNYFPSIRVNLKGREQDGQVDPENYHEFCDVLCRQIEGWAPVHKAWRRDELYEGPCVDRAPDIVLELALENGYSHSCLRSRGGASFRRIEPTEYLGGKERGMNGNHRPTGVLFMSRPCEATDSSLLDVAPTVYAVMNVASPPMDGTSLLGDTPKRAEEATTLQSQVYSPEEEAAIEARLRNLGYFE